MGGRLADGWVLGTRVVGGWDKQGRPQSSSVPPTHLHLGLRHPPLLLRILSAWEGRVVSVRVFGAASARDSALRTSEQGQRSARQTRAGLRQGVPALGCKRAAASVQQQECGSQARLWAPTATATRRLFQLRSQVASKPLGASPGL